RHGIEHAGRVADEQRAATSELRFRAPHRQSVPAEVRELVNRDAVVLAEELEMGTEARALAAPPADTDVDVVALREDPAVTARKSRKLEHEHPAPTVRREPLVGEVALQRDAVDDPAAEVERLRGDAVRAVCADDGIDVHAAPVDPHGAVGFDLGADAVAEVHAGGGGLLDEERVESAPLCHQAEDVVRAPPHHWPDLAPAPGIGRRVAHNWLDGERQLPYRAHRQTAATGLVAREAGFFY